LLNYLTGLTELITEKASALPFSTIENIGMVPIEAILLFFVIFIFMLFLMNRKMYPLRYPVYALLIFVSAGTIRNISDRTSVELIIYNIAGSDAIGIRTGKILNLYSDTTFIPPEVQRHCSTRELRIKTDILDKNCTGLLAGNRRILICNCLNSSFVQEVNPDFIVLRGLYPKVEKQIRFPEQVKSLIITPQVSTYFNIPDNLRNSKTNIHLVKISGAFRARL
jgi:hypothetical protein